MKYFKIVEPWAQTDGSIYHAEVVLSEETVLEDYFPYWKKKMTEAGKGDLVSEENCLEDWITVNYAKEVNKE